MSYKYLCTNCKKAFNVTKFVNIDDQHNCPECGLTTYVVSEKYQTPKKIDKKAWKVVRYLMENNVRTHIFIGNDGISKKYPPTMSEATKYVEQLKKKL